MMGKATQEHDKSLEMLREYFMTKRGERAQAIAAKRASRTASVWPEATAACNGKRHAWHG